MAYLSQASSAISNSPKMTFSAWVRASTVNAASPGGEYFPIFSWGTRSSKPFGPSIIALQTNTSNSGNYLSFNFVGVPDSIDMGGNVSPPATFSGDGSVWTPVSGMNVPNVNYTANPTYSAMLGPNQWMHIMLAVDFTDPSSKSVGSIASSAGKAICYVNGQYLGRLGSGFNNSLWTYTQTHPDMPATFGTDKIWSRAANYANYGSFFLGSGAVFRGEWIPSDAAEDTYTITIPGWSMSISGTEIGIPSQSADAASNNKIDFGDVQVWFGQYIDPQVASNFSKFVTISGGVGRPVNPATAAAAFGTQTILFKGNSSSFYTNGGNGGSFSKVGTLNDFTPSPTY